MVNVLDRQEIGYQETEAASDGRFFDPIDPWLMGIVRAFPEVKAAAQAAQQKLNKLPRLLKAHKDGISKSRFPKAIKAVDRLIQQEGTYPDDASLISTEGHTVVKKILSRAAIFENIGNHSYWLRRAGNITCLCTTDDSCEPMIYLADNSDHQEGSRIATPEDYAQLLRDIDAETVRQTSA